MFTSSPHPAIMYYHENQHGTLHSYPSHKVVSVPFIMPEAANYNYLQAAICMRSLLNGNPFATYIVCARRFISLRWSSNGDSNSRPLFYARRVLSLTELLLHMLAFLRMPANLGRSCCPQKLSLHPVCLTGTKYFTGKHWE